MERINPRSRSDAYGSRINRAHSPALAHTVPWISIAMASLIPMFPIATALPYMPPLGFIMLIAWRMQRPGLLPVWAGFPLGLFDDLYSGQPFGSAIALWSLAMIALEMLETRFPWRHFLIDWITAAGLIMTYLLLGMLLSGAEMSWPLMVAILPQIVVSILIYPILSRLVARLDRFRLMRVRIVA